MSRTLSRKRPWLAAVLAALATGLGHLYLRRWRRALGWLAVIAITNYALVDPGTLDELARGTVTDPLAVMAMFLVAALSVADAYLLARAQNAIVRMTVTSDGRLTHCPNCGEELEGDLDFCQWCATEVPDLGELVPDEESTR